MGLHGGPAQDNEFPSPPILVLTNTMRSVAGFPGVVQQHLLPHMGPPGYCLLSVRHYYDNCAMGPPWASFYLSKFTLQLVFFIDVMAFVL